MRARVHFKIVVTVNGRVDNSVNVLFKSPRLELLDSALPKRFS